MRIAFLSEHASPVALLGGADAGGQNVYVDEVSRNLGRLGYKVDVFTRRDDPTAPTVIEWAPNVRVVNLAAGPPHVLPKDQLWPYMPRFRELLLAFMARDGVSYDLLHGNFWMSGAIVAELRARLDIPAVQIFHAMGKTKRRHQGDADTSAPARIAVEERVIRAVDRVIAQCPAEVAELIDDYGAPRDKIAVIPSAVNTAVYRPVPRDEARRRIGLAPDNHVVVYVGRMLPRKDVRNVVRAFALLLRRYSEAGLDEMRAYNQTPLLLLVGGESVEPDPVATPEIGELQRLAAELGVADRVRFVGKRQPDVLRDYYSAGDVAVTTPWYEPFGLTPLEAMACGVPVVGSAVGGITYTIADGETGLLVPPRDPASLAGALYDLLEAPDARRRMGAAARARAERLFTWPVVAARTAALYEELSVDSCQPSVEGAIVGAR
jgi:D-inositol-3-phosphate glycosyltransferase